MTATALAIHLASALVFANVVWRLCDLRHPKAGCWRTQLDWHIRMIGLVFIGLGLAARLFQLPAEAVALVSLGLVLYFGTRWHRRSDGEVVL